MNDDRNEKLERATLDGGVTVKGLNLRPFSLGTLSLCRQLKLTQFTGTLDGSKLELTPEESQRQLAIFAWMQSEPLKCVLEHVRNNTYEHAVQEFEFTMEMGLLPALTAEIERISALAGAASVEVVEKPGSESDSAAPPKS